MKSNNILKQSRWFYVVYEYGDERPHDYFLLED